MPLRVRITITYYGVRTTKPDKRQKHQTRLQLAVIFYYVTVAIKSNSYIHTQEQINYLYYLLERQYVARNRHYKTPNNK